MAGLLLWWTNPQDPCTQPRILPSGPLHPLSVGPSPNTMMLGWPGWMVREGRPPSVSPLRPFCLDAPPQAGPRLPQCHVISPESSHGAGAAPGRCACQGLLYRPRAPHSAIVLKAPIELTRGSFFSLSEIRLDQHEHAVQFHRERAALLMFTPGCCKALDRAVRVHCACRCMLMPLHVNAG